MEKAVLFDFDGVLIDTFALALRVNQMIFPDLSHEEYSRVFESNIFEGFKAVREKHRAKDGIDFYTEYNPSVISQPMFQGMAEVIRELAGKYKLFIISSSHGEPITAWLTKHGLREYFQKVLGSDTHESKVAKLKMLSEEFGTGGHNAVFVTDTLGDINEAKEMGIRAIAVSWGFQKPEILLKGNPAALVKTPAELAEAVEKFLSAK